MFGSMGQSNVKNLGNGGTMDGDVTITGDLNVSGGISLSLNEVLQGTSTIDITNTEALLVRKNSDGGDIFIVDTDSPLIKMGGNLTFTHDVATISSTTGLLQFRILESGQDMLFDAGGDFKFRDTDDSNATRVTIQSGTGNFGIGGTPSDDLHVINSENVYIQLESSNTGTTKESAIKYSNFSTGSNFWWAGLNQSDDYSLAYGTSFSGSNTMFLITETGSVGIGSSVPDAWSYTNPVLTLSGGTTANNYVGFNLGSYSTSTTGIIGDINFTQFASDGTTGAERAIIRGLNDGATDSVALKFYTTATGGSVTERMVINSDGTTTFHYDPTISSYNGNLTVKSANASDGDATLILISDAGATNEDTWKINADGGDNDLDFINHTNTRMTLTSGGNVTITGTATVTGALIDLRASADTDSEIIFREGSTAKAVIFNDASANSLSLSDGSGNLSPVLNINSGSVGIGTSSPASALNIEGTDNTSSKITITNTSGTDNTWSIHANYNTQALTFTGDSTEVMTLLDTGLVGIGTTSPYSPLHVKSSAEGSIGGLEGTDGTFIPQVVIEGSGTTATKMSPTLALFNSSTGADGDTLGSIMFMGGDSTTQPPTTPANASVYAGILAKITDETNSSNDGELHFLTTSGNDNTNTAMVLDTNSRISLSNNDGGGSGGNASTSANTLLGYGIADMDSGSISNTLIGHRVAGNGSHADMTNNTGVGNLALYYVSSGDQNTALGSVALHALTTGSNNVAVGSSAMGSGTVTGDENVSIGKDSMYDATSASGVVAVGTESAYNITSGSESVAIGKQALYTATTVGGNTAVGYQALKLNTVAGNTAVGHSALLNNSSGINVAVGYQSGTTITSGTQNTLIGYQAGQDITEGGRNTAVGHLAFGGALDANGDESFDNTFIGFGSGAGDWVTAVSNKNTAVGAYTMQGAMNGSLNNTALGYASLQNLTTGDNNVAVGYNSLDAGTDAHDNTAIGYASLGSSTSVGYAVAIGREAMNNGNVTSDADGAVGIGYKALYALTSGGKNVAVGNIAGSSITTGDSNVAIGHNAMDELVDGDRNIAIGHNAMGDVVGGTTSDGSDDNIAIGFQSQGGAWANAECLKNVSIGSYSLDGALNGALENVAIGYQALTDLTEGDSNVAIGMQSLQNVTTAVQNVAVGSNAGNDITVAGECAILGHNAGSAITDHGRSVFVGHNAGANQEGEQNIFIGKDAGLGVSGSNNDGTVAVGFDSLKALTSGAGNTAIGYTSGADVTTGFNNTLIGYNAGNTGTVDLLDGNSNTYIGFESRGSSASAINQTVIGKGAHGQGNNSVTLGNADVTAVYMAQDSGATIYASNGVFIDDTSFITVRDSSAYSAGTGGGISFQGLDSAENLKQFGTIQGYSIGNNNGGVAIFTRDTGSNNLAVVIDNNRAVKPGADSAYDLGTSSLTWRNLFVENIIFPATQVASADANVLDDYEEGDYDITFTCGTSGTITLQSGYNRASYVKIGSFVSVTGLAIVDSVSSPSGFISVNLPFTPVNLTDRAGDSAVALEISGVASANVADFQGAVNEATAVFYIQLGDGTTRQADSAEQMQASTQIHFSVQFRA